MAGYLSLRFCVLERAVRNPGLCIFYFIDKIVSVLYIVQFYAEEHTGARCESLNKCHSSRRSYCVMRSLMLCIK